MSHRDVERVRYYVSNLAILSHQHHHLFAYDLERKRRKEKEEEGLGPV